MLANVFSPTDAAEASSSRSSARSSIQESFSRIKAEQLDLISTHAPTGFLVGFLTVIMVGGVFWGVVPLERLCLWAAMCGVLTSPILLFVWRYRRAGPPPEQASYWSRLFAFGYGLSGLGWGMSGLLIFPSHSLAHQLFLVFIVGGHAAGGMSALSSSPLIFRAYLGATLVPFVVRLWFAEEPVMVAIGLMLSAFGLAMVTIGRYLSVMLAETLRLRFENLDLVESLSVSKERAEAASQAKSQFLANVSHELRTPMNGVLGMVELLSRTSLTERQQQLVRNAQRAGDMLLSLINELLDVTKIEAGKLELACLDFRPRVLIDEVLSLFAEAAVVKGVSLRKIIAHDIPEVLQGDPVRLRQILTNLIGNALKFTQQGEVIVAVGNQQPSIESQVSNGRMKESQSGVCTLHFSVQDTGIGVALEAREHIFESFVQADGSMTRKYGGTGLGLSIAKQLTQLMGGEIGVESKEGQGATFWFTARFSIVSASLEQAMAVDQFPQFLSSQSLDPLPLVRPLDVLLVEDHEVNQEVTRGLLALLGCHVEVASNGRQALDALRPVAPDLILMDCQMPEMDGFTTTTEIRKREARAGTGHTPIVALTANAMLGDRERCLTAGMDDYLSKPFSLQELREVILRRLPEEKKVKILSLSPKLDHGTFNGFRDFAKEGVAKLFSSTLQSYLDHTPQLVETLHRAVSRSDAGALHLAAHTLKSSSASLGALTLASLCQELESTSKTGSVAHAVVLLPTLDAEYQAVCDALLSELQKDM